MNRSTRPTILLAAVLAALACCAPAQAQVSLGRVPGSSPPVVCAGTAVDLLQSSTSAVPSPYVVPDAGVITSWSTFATAGTDQAYKLKIFRPVVAPSYLVVAQDARPLSPGVLNAFPVAIPVQAGDLIGINSGIAANACAVETGSPKDEFGAAKGDASNGSTVDLKPVSAGYALNLAATLTRPPTVGLLAPVKGSIKGGAAVAVSGTEFTGASGVSFGGVAARSFTVVSDTQIAAIAPAGKKPGAVDLTVTNAAGTTTAVKFTYLACVVPKLKGKTLKTDRKKLKKAGCKLGTVRGQRSKSAKTVKQNPKPGKVLAPGAKVGVKLES